ncbi:MAG: hypothetical protein WD993_09870 [Thermoleophilaceae bacterium]
MVAAFKASTDSPGNVITAATDFRAPEVTAVAVVKSEGGTAGHVRQGGGYHVYANVAADTGEPASGIASVTADASALTAGSTAVALSAGSYTADGASYGYRSALLTADDPLAEGSAGFSVTATDSASNSDTASGTATVDNTAPQADDVQTSNASGGSAGLAEAGDTLTLTSSEILDPATILSGWTGASADVVVRIYDGGATADHVEIWAAGNASALPLGTVALGGTGYVTGGAGDHIEFGSAGTASSMAQSGAAITIALGSYQTPTAAVAGTESTSGTVEWTPSTTLTDRAGNALGATAATESGAADVEL